MKAYILIDPSCNVCDEVVEERGYYMNCMNNYVRAFIPHRVLLKKNLNIAENMSLCMLSSTLRLVLNTASHFTF